jgi:DNA-binding MarR family transcriptional regulator
MDMGSDTVDQLMEDWTRERPDLDARGLGITGRISLLGKVLAREDKRALAPLGLAPWACDVLLALRRQGSPCQLTPTDLRRVTLLTSGAMTTRLDRLEEAGLVLRSLDSDDRRSFQVKLTDQGRQLADRALEARLGMVERLLAPLSAEESQAAAGLLRKLLVGAKPE